MNLPLLSIYPKNGCFHHQGTKFFAIFCNGKHLEYFFYRRDAENAEFSPTKGMNLRARCDSAVFNILLTITFFVIFRVFRPLW